MNDFAQEYGQFIASHRFESVNVGGYGFGVISAGGGRQAVVFLNCMDVYHAWAKYVGALSGQYRAVVLRYPTALYKVAEMTAALRALFKKLGIEAPVLCSAGDGGVLAQLYARRYRVGGLVMTSALTADCSYAQRLRRDKALLPVARLYVKSLSPQKIEELLAKKAEKLFCGESAEEREYALSFLSCVCAQAGFRAGLLRALNAAADMCAQPKLAKSDLAYLRGRVLVLIPENDMLDGADVRKMTDVFTEPAVRTVCGGNLGVVTRAVLYIEQITEFLARVCEE